MADDKHPSRAHTNPRSDREIEPIEASFEKFWQAFWLHLKLRAHRLPTHAKHEQPAKKAAVLLYRRKACSTRKSARRPQAQRSPRLTGARPRRHSRTPLRVPASQQKQESPQQHRSQRLDPAGNWERSAPQLKRGHPHSHASHLQKDLPLGAPWRPFDQAHTKLHTQPRHRANDAPGQVTPKMDRSVHPVGIG
ncbi:Hypothetical predicted protein [Pelobates cultripes]|uniref:Uncharacterized protein n=1 Tax=Pelobates cultripes TaxID=61616 RepID=A0AAD1VM89_PELCU|nr:Hypothetical predicted protein [Pelobates cultripes]